MAPLSAKETSKSSLCLSFSFGFRYRKQETNMFFFLELYGEDQGTL